MSTSNTRQTNKELFAKGEVTLIEKGSSRGFSEYRVNGALKPFTLRYGLRMPLTNVSNAINHAKVHINDTGDKCCRKCAVEMLTDNCTKGKIQKFMI